jgi:phospholipase/carboxylesterase
VIWLHGLGADGNDFVPVVRMLSPRRRSSTRFVFPHAPECPVTINGGWVMPSWYDILDLDPRRIDERGVEQSAAQLGALVERELRGGIDLARIVLAGFSQGGAVALFAALRMKTPPAGVVALSTYLVCDDPDDEGAYPGPLGLPVFQAHGEHDPMVPVVLGRAARDRLTGLGCDVEWRTYPMGHEVHPREIQDLGAWLDRILE